jgi:hypothetical protein
MPQPTLTRPLPASPKNGVSLSSISDALGPLPPQFYVIDTRVAAALSPAWATLCAPNPLRWGLIIAAPLVKASATITPSWVSTVPSTVNPISGIAMNSGQQPLMLTFRDFGALVQQSWYGSTLNITGVSTWDITEVFIQQ